MAPPLVRARQTVADARARDGELVALVDYAQALADESQDPSTHRAARGQRSACTSSRRRTRPTSSSRSKALTSKGNAA